MNSLLSIFCYIISNVSIRKNLHRVQLIPKDNITPRSNVSYVYKGHGMLCPINLGQSSQYYKNLSKAKQSKAYTSSGFQTICPINLGQFNQYYKNLSKAKQSKAYTSSGF